MANMNIPAGDQYQNTAKPSSSSSSSSLSWRKNKLVKRTAFLLILGVAVALLLLYHFAHPYNTFSLISAGNLSNYQGIKKEYEELERILKGAATEDKTVILTTSNEAWAEPGSTTDVFLESFKSGNNTSRLLKHLVIISLDQNAHDRCLAMHRHCYLLKPKAGDNFSGEAYFMTPTYLEMMWTRIDLLSIVLQLGYNFVFTDADIVWLQDPFPHFYEGVDFQIACDVYNGNPNDRKNKPNGGFTYVVSNKRSITFYKYWYASRLRFPEKHDQDVLNKIKFDLFINKIGLKMKFLDTKYFGGFCQQSKDFNSICTMHANCCFGLEKKVKDLRIINEDWRRFMLAPPNIKAVSTFTWRAPKYCWGREGNQL